MNSESFPGETNLIPSYTHQFLLLDKSVETKFNVSFLIPLNTEINNLGLKFYLG